MKTLTSLLLVSATLVGPTSFAQNNETHTLTRTQVISELRAAQAAGQLSVGESAYPPALQHTSSLTRAQVKAELQAAQAAGQLGVGESDYPPVRNHTSSVTRAQVVAELRAAKAAGQLLEPGS